MVQVRDADPASLELVDAARTRYELLASSRDLRVAKGWELVLVALRYVGLCSVTSTAIDVPEVIGSATLAAGCAALASGPRVSDFVVGKATATRAARTVSIEHERRPIDPIDGFWAFLVAAITKDAAVLAALEGAVGDIEPDPAYAGRRGHERTLYRSAFAALTAAGVGAWDRAREAIARTKLEAEQTLHEVEEYRRERFADLVLPLVLALGVDDPVAAVEATLGAHHRHWNVPQRQNEPSGFIAWGPLAIAALRGVPSSAVPAMDYVPHDVAVLLDGSSAAEHTQLAYEVQELRARSVAEALLRVELSTPGDVTQTERDGRVEIVTRGPVAYRYSFVIDPDHEGPSLLDIGELVWVAERDLTRASELPEASSERTQARERGRACAERALAMRGADDELYRDRMSSPLGRTLCDDHPEKLAREALSRLVTSFG